MSDEIEITDDETTAPEAFTGSGAPQGDQTPTVPPAEELGETAPEVGAAPDAPEDAEPVAEPTPVGHAVVQDNVSDPGVETTHEVDGSGQVVGSTSHESATAPAADEDAEPAEDAE